MPGFLWYDTRTLQVPGYDILLTPEPVEQWPKRMSTNKGWIVRCDCGINTRIHYNTAFEIPDGYSMAPRSVNFRE